MIDMLAVSSAINRAKIDLSASPKGILSLESRTTIWIAMNDFADAEASYLNRTHLKVLCVNKVKSIWTQVFPADSSIDRMLQLTHALMGKNVDPGAAENDASRFLQNVIAKFGSNATTNPALMVADAAAAMVVSACYRNPDYDTADNDIDDDELAPDSFETSYMCASAAAGGMNWMPVDQVDVNARRAFWMWYLDEAIPAALRS
ncbi:Imm5 family immunity protein [Actinomyces sp. oral taxon 171]|mgnify:FL=1|uniref:Imm5 family immunity protein n=1 Tax=Actinomyces sp. oral taxon 171 TaxID=706438 RepID=UPI001788B7D7|nr:Imm5 family immunity protein [Actinomyces sp. oral taxon 171]